MADRRNTQSPIKTKTVDPNVLKELAKKAQGLSPEEGVEVIMAEMKKLDPDFTPPSRRVSQADQLRPPSVKVAAVPPVVTKEDDAKKKAAERRERRQQTRDKPSSSPATGDSNARKEALKKSLPPPPPKEKRGSGGYTVHASKFEKAAKEKKEKKVISAEDKEKRMKHEQKRRIEAVERDDTKWLEGLKVNPLLQEEVFEPKPAFSFEDYRKVFSLATRLHGSGTIPEVVLLGVNGTGKSLLLESLMGYLLNTVGFKEGGKTKRPLVIQIVSNENCTTPKCTFLHTDKKNETVDITSISAEIEKNSSSQFSPEPLMLQFEVADAINFVLIDTPGLPFDTDSDEYSQVYVFLAEVLRNSNRLMVCVEEPNQSQWDTSGATAALRHLVKKVDPHGTRTLWVYNKFFPLIDNMTSMELFQYFSVNYTPNSYFITLLSSKERDKSRGKEKLLERLAQVERRDRNRLDFLCADKQYMSNVGIDALRKRIVDWCWRRYQQLEIPKLFATVTAKKKQTAAEIDQMEKQISNLNLKLIASQYAARYVQLAQSVLLGTARGNPGANGETLKEEIDEQFFASADWEIQGKPIPFELTKLYGGQQFERVFSEFKQITKQLKVEDDASSLPPISDKKFFSSACDYAEKRAEDLMIPLIDNLIERVTFVLRRIPIVVSFIMESKETLPNPKHKLPIDERHCAPMGTYLKDLYYSSVDKHGKTCKQLCQEEFYPTKTIIWILGEEINMEKLKDEASALTEIFNKIRDRVTANVLRKVYNFFLLPFFKAELWDEIQGTIFKMDLTTLEEIFEVTTIEDQLDRELEELEIALDQLHDDEISLYETLPKLS